MTEIELDFILIREELSRSQNQSIDQTSVESAYKERWSRSKNEQEEEKRIEDWMGQMRREN